MTRRHAESHLTAILIFTAILGLLMAIGAADAQPEPEPGSVAVIFDAGPSSAEGATAAPGPVLAVEAEAQPPAVDPSVGADPLDTAGEIVEDVKSGDWRHAVAGLLILAMLGLKKARDRVPWFAGDRGGAVLVLSLGLAGAFSTALYSSSALDWRLLVGALGTVASSVGAYTLIKRIVRPSS